MLRFENVRPARCFASLLACALLALAFASGGCRASEEKPAVAAAAAAAGAVSDATKTGAGAAPPGSAPPVDLAAPGAGGAANDAGGGAPAAAPITEPTEMQDECTPVGVDFEKRARPKLKDCYAAGKKKDPNLEGTVRLTVEIDGLGKVKGMKVTEKTLPDPVAECMLKALKSTPLPDASKCPGRSILIPVTFPTPR